MLKTAPIARAPFFAADLAVCGRSAAIGALVFILCSSADESSGALMYMIEGDEQPTTFTPSPPPCGGRSRR